MVCSKSARFVKNLPSINSICSSTAVFHLILHLCNKHKKICTLLQLFYLKQIHITVIPIPHCNLQWDIAILFQKSVLYMYMIWQVCSCVEEH